MRLGSNEPIKTPVAPKTRSELMRIIIALMAIMLLIGAGLFLLLGRGTGGPLVPTVSESPSASATLIPTERPTPSPTLTIDLGTSPGSCLVVAQSVCDLATFGDYQPSSSGAYRAAMITAPTGSVVFAPITGTISALQSASFLDSDGQPTQIPDARMEITSDRGEVFVVLFRYPAEDFSVRQQVRAGTRLGILGPDVFALSGETWPNLAVVTMHPGAGGLLTVDVEAMRELFPGY